MPYSYSSREIKGGSGKQGYQAQRGIFLAKHAESNLLVDIFEHETPSSAQPLVTISL
jgi:hypothetical protein